MLFKDTIGSETKRAFDLLDAISRSGTLPVSCAEFHVIISVSHCFEKNLLATVIEDNINPIEKVEKSVLLLTSAIYDQQNVSELVVKNNVERLSRTFPVLFGISSSSES